MTKKFKCRLSLLLFTGLTLFLTGCNKQDKVIPVADDDAEMVAAIQKARTSLPLFWEVFEKREHLETDFCLKVRITDKTRIEHFWLVNIERKDGKIFGTINNDPDSVKNVKINDRVMIPEADISDWLFMRNGKMVGNYTIRALFKKMPADEVAKYKQMLADP